MNAILAPSRAPFARTLRAHGLRLPRTPMETLQVNVEKLRGRHVFDPNIRALRKLNALGYGQGQAGSGLALDLVYNPLGAALPPPQERLEDDYRRELGTHFGIVFNRRNLAEMERMPIAFADHC